MPSEEQRRDSTNRKHKGRGGYGERGTGVVMTPSIVKRKTITGEGGPGEGGVLSVIYTSRGGGGLPVVNTGCSSSFFFIFPNAITKYHVLLNMKRFDTSRQDIIKHAPFSGEARRGTGGLVFSITVVVWIEFESV